MMIWQVDKKYIFQKNFRQRLEILLNYYEKTT